MDADTEPQEASNKNNLIKARRSSRQRRARERGSLCMDSEREAQAIVIFEAESRKIATTPVDGWRALGCLFTGEGEPPISECCQQGVQLCSLHATVDEESGWGAKQGSRPYMEARPISDVGRPGRSLVHRGE